MILKASSTGKFLLGIFSPFLFTADAIDVDLEKHKEEQRELAQSLILKGENIPIIPINQDSFSELSEILNSDKLVSFVNNLKSDDLTELKANLKSSLNTTEQKKIFENLRIYIGNLNEAELENIVGFITENEKPKSILNRLHESLDPGDQKKLENLTREFLCTKEGEYLSLALTNLSIKSEGSLKSKNLEKLIPAVALLVLCVFALVNLKIVKDTPILRSRDSGIDIERMREATAKNKKANQLNECGERVDRDGRYIIDDF